MVVCITHRYDTIWYCNVSLSSRFCSTCGPLSTYMWLCVCACAALKVRWCHLNDFMVHMGIAQSVSTMLRQAHGISMHFMHSRWSTRCLSTLFSLQLVQLANQKQQKCLLRHTQNFLDVKKRRCADTVGQISPSYSLGTTGPISGSMYRTVQIMNPKSGIRPFHACVHSFVRNQPLLVGSWRCVTEVLIILFSRWFNDHFMIFHSRSHHCVRTHFNLT